MFTLPERTKRAAFVSGYTRVGAIGDTTLTVRDGSGDELVWQTIDDFQALGGRGAPLGAAAYSLIELASRGDDCCLLLVGWVGRLAAVH